MEEQLLLMKDNFAEMIAVGPFLFLIIGNIYYLQSRGTTRTTTI